MDKLNLDDLLSKLSNTKKIGNGFSSRCPSHDDSKNSLSFSEKPDGTILLYCHAGCSYQQIIASLGAFSAQTDFTEKKNGKIAAVYNYTDENGKMLYQNVRFEPKGFGQRHFDEKGREVWNLNGVRRVPYRLPELLKLTNFQDFVMTEGEKDADALLKLGLPATNHKNWLEEFNFILKGKQTIIFQDHDCAGAAQAEKTAKMVLRDAKAVKIVDCFADEPLPEKHGKDVSDYLESHSLDDLFELITQTPIYNPSVNADISSPINQMKVIRLADVEVKEIDWLWKPFISIGELTLISGPEGIGKSWIVCAIACAIANGKQLPFSKQLPIAPSNVLMLSAEDSLSHTLKPRLLSMNANLEKIFAIDEVFSFSDEKDLIRFKAVVATHEPKLVIIDPIFSYTGGKNLNQESESRPIAQKLITIAQKFDCAICAVRHIGKSKGYGDPRAAGLGSISWRAAARSELLVGKDEETAETAFCQTKNNLAPMPDFAVGYEIEDGMFFWKAEPSKLTAAKMLAQPKLKEHVKKQDETAEILREFLKGGEKPSEEVEEYMSQLGITDYAYRKARRILGVEAFKRGGNFGGEKAWYIRLPNSEDVDSKTEDDDIMKNQHLQPNQSNKTIYTNHLAEDVEISKNGHLQQFKTASIKGSASIWRVKVTCKCGTQGDIGERCPNCNEIIIPF